MTNWPNIQEYRNFEAKFVDDPERNVSIESSGVNELETVTKDEFKPKPETEEVQNLQNNSESKTVRCIIKKDFEESFKKSDRGDGFVNHDSLRPKTNETQATAQSSVDKIRLQNHLKWKKQKEEEYLQKKEAEKLAQQKKKEEELRLERIKKQKEKERDEKIREWQEQKAREKEEKKKEKMLMKELEEELKEVTPVVDKEKLIEEWVKLKNKQKQIEAEKKAEILKKEEENRALRQNLAQISYRQWKERVKGRMMALPKNGYQIFGPKPAPVVKEDWNHDFINSSPRDRSSSLGGAKSIVTNSLTFRTGSKDLEDLCKDIFYIGDTLLKNRSPSFYHLKTAKSGLTLCDVGESPHKGNMPLKELQPATIDLKKMWTKDRRLGYWEKNENFFPQEAKIDLKSKSKGKTPARNQQQSDYAGGLAYCPPSEGDQNRYLASAQTRKLSGVLNSFPDPQVLPNKKKIDLYINTGCTNIEETSPVKQLKRQTNEVRKEEKREVTDRKPSEGVKKLLTRENSYVETRRKSSTSLRRDTKSTERNLNLSMKKTLLAETPKEKISRRSRSYDTPPKKFPKDIQKGKGCSSSRSFAKEEPVAPAKGKTTFAQKRKSRKPSTPETPKPSSTDLKNKKKPKKKNLLTKSFSFIDSPYCVKSSKSQNKMKASRRKGVKGKESKGDDQGPCRKFSAPKI